MSIVQGEESEGRCRASFCGVDRIQFTAKEPWVGLGLQIVADRLLDVAHLRVERDHPESVPEQVLQPETNVK